MTDAPDRTGPALATQAVRGAPVGVPGPAAECGVCGTALAEGQPVTATAERPVEAPTWDLTRVACPACERAYTPTLGVEGVVVRGWLAVRSLPAAREHVFVLAGLERKRYSPPAEGATP